MDGIQFAYYSYQSEAMSLSKYNYIFATGHTNISHNFSYHQALTSPLLAAVLDRINIQKSLAFKLHTKNKK